MRAGLAGMPVAHPIGERLPAVYAEDDFAQRMTSALDDVLAPVFATLDCFPDYLDPILAPADFVEWLSGWVAFALDEGWTLAQRRALVANAVELHRWRGTARGLEAHVRLLTLGDVEIVDSGACTFSERPGIDVPSRGAHVTVKVLVPDPRTVDQIRLLAAIVEAVPAHVRVALELGVLVTPPRAATGRASASAKVSGSASVPSAAAPPAAGGPARGAAKATAPVPGPPPGSLPLQAMPPGPAVQSESFLTGQLQKPGYGPDPSQGGGQAPQAPAGGPAGDPAPGPPPQSEPATGRARGVARPGGPGASGPGASGGSGNAGGAPSVGGGDSSANGPTETA